MSATAIGQVTVALKELLKANLAGVTVSLLQPNDTLSKNSVNLYLYRVVENAQLKNTDWRGDRAHPPAPFPALALELYYLLTPFADAPASGQATLPQAHTILGSAMQVFLDHPVVNDVHDSLFDFETLPGVGDLRNAFDKIIVRLQNVSVEDLSKIWMMFSQPYRLSVVYQVSLVRIAPTAPPTSRTAPVMVTALDVFTLSPPGLTEVSPAKGGTGAVLLLRGRGLARKAFTTRVTFGGQAVEPVSVTAEEIQIRVPTDLDAGPDQEIRVLLDGRTSGPQTYVVSPWLRRLEPQRGAPSAAGSPFLVTLNVLGEDLSTAGVIAVSLAATGIAHAVIDETHISIAVPATVPNGRHPVQVDVDGRTSNIRVFEVLPRLDSLVPAVPVVGSALQVNGERLDGTLVSAAFGPATFALGTNATANQVQVPRVPRLDPGTYELRVTVDGVQSNPLPFTVV